MKIKHYQDEYYVSENRLEIPKNVAYSIKITSLKILIQKEKLQNTHLNVEQNIQ